MSTCATRVWQTYCTHTYHNRHPVVLLSCKDEPFIGPPLPTHPMQLSVAVEHVLWGRASHRSQALLCSHVFSCALPCFQTLSYALLSSSLHYFHSSLCDSHQFRALLYHTTTRMVGFDGMACEPLSTQDIARATRPPTAHQWRVLRGPHRSMTSRLSANKCCKCRLTSAPLKGVLSSAPKTSHIESIN